MGVRLKDIADKLDLSVTSVSLVLNNKPNKLPAKTRNLIVKTAREMKYMPNQIAISLKKKRTNTIGLIVPDIRNSFFSYLARGIEEKCRELNFTLILCNTQDRHKRDIEYINMLRSKNVDGILYCMSSDSDKEIFMESVNLIKSIGIPFLCVDRHFSLPEINSVTLDHIQGGKIATNHLLDLGHKKIACITGPLNLKDSQDRLSGYKLALKDKKIPIDSSLIKEGKYDIESGYLCTKDLIKSSYFTSIFACNDMMAYGAYKALKEHRLKVPKDISLMGYDDIFLSDIFEVPLTTIKQPIEELGETSTEGLIKLIKNESDELTFKPFKPELMVRKSTSKCMGNCR